MKPLGEATLPWGLIIIHSYELSGKELESVIRGKLIPTDTLLKSTGRISNLSFMFERRKIK